jgi:hypothetical protein
VYRFPGLPSATSTVAFTEVDNTQTFLNVTPNPAGAGAPVTLHADVVSLGGGLATGKVVFYDGSTALGTETLSGTSSLTSLGLKATYTTTALPEGTDQLKAVYQGTVGFMSSTSPVVKETVQAATAPVGQVPEVPWAAGLPVLAIGIGAGTWRRRRHRA